MAPKASLELLPVELQIQLLLQLDANNLHASIRASPRLYQTFRSDKERILSHTARKLFHPAALSAALCFARLARWERPLRQDRATAFLRTSQEERKCRLISYRTPISQSIELCKLAKRIDFFINDYTRNLLLILHQVGGESQDTPIATEYAADYCSGTSLQLTVSETGRLQRAFCHFELYCRLFATCSGDTKECQRSGNRISRQIQIDFFLLKHRPFEIAEMHCIRDYFYRRLRGVIDQVANEAVGAPFAVYYEQEDACCSSREKCPYLFRYSGKDEQNGNLEHLMSLGLRYIRSLPEATGAKRRDLALHGSDTCCGGLSEYGFLMDALDRLERDFTRVQAAPSIQEDLNQSNSHGDHLLIPSGWLSLFSNCERLYISKEKGFRDWGYVFWDPTRLHTAGIWDLGPGRPNNLSFCDFTANDRPSVQERLMGPEHEKRAAEMRAKRERLHSDEADQLEDEWEEEPYYLRKRLRWKERSRSIRLLALGLLITVLLQPSKMAQLGVDPSRYGVFPNNHVAFAHIAIQ